MKTAWTFLPIEALMDRRPPAVNDCEVTLQAILYFASVLLNEIVNLMELN
jgi:hypothetical protein